MKLQNLTILSEINPMGVDCKPYFSYILTSEKKDTFQKKYHIRVSDGCQTVWEREEETNKSVFIPYEGHLKSRTRYDVKISVTDNHNEEDTITGSFETALLNKSDWKAQWVKSSLPAFPAEKGFGKQPPATMFRKKFHCRAAIAKARLYCTCHGIYVPYLNGKRFSEREFAPEHSTYGKVLFYQTYDVTEKILYGENTLSMYVGDGWYLGVKTMPRVENYERRHAVLFQLEITYTDGTRQIICSDEQVQCAYGPVRCSDLFAGEHYDANVDFAQWVNAETANYGYDNLVAQHDAGVTLRETIPVKQVLYTPAGETVLDFGKVLAGRVRMHIDVPKGVTVALTHSEVLDQDGNFFQNTQMPDGGVEQTDVFVGNGEARVYEPIFTYHGFRYVKVEGIRQVRAEDFSARVYSSDGANSGDFFCSDERLNTLYKNIRNAQKKQYVLHSHGLPATGKGRLDGRYRRLCADGSAQRECNPLA